MIRNIILLSFIIFSFFSIYGSEDKERSPLKSSVRFYRNIDQKEFLDWESKFFKFPKNEEEPDSAIEKVVETTDVENLKPVVKKSKSQPALKIEMETEPPSLKEEPVLKEKAVIEEIAKKPVEMEIVEKHDKEQIKIIKEKPAQPVVKKEETPVADLDAEENDEEQVDSSERMRKMKEMMRKKKGNRRIEDRRVY
jgi:hypothetical protein